MTDRSGSRIASIEGETEIFVEEKLVAVAEAGSVIGEIAIVSNRPRSATVRAKTAINVASVDSETFYTLVAHFPGVKEAMGAVMSEHLSSDNQRQGQ